jgi:hypothetical protein
MVHTPVGARCAQCAQLKKLPTYTLSPGHYLVAGAVGASLALAVGFVWRMLLLSLYLSLLDFLLAAGAGLVIAELVSQAVNRRRGLALQVIAALSLTIAFFLAHTSSLEGAMFLILRAPLSLLALALGIFVAVGRLR